MSSVILLLLLARKLGRKMRQAGFGVTSVSSLCILTASAMRNNNSRFTDTCFVIIPGICTKYRLLLPWVFKRDQLRVWYDECSLQISIPSEVTWESTMHYHSHIAKATVSKAVMSSAKPSDVSTEVAQDLLAMAIRVILREVLMVHIDGHENIEGESIQPKEFLDLLRLICSAQLQHGFIIVVTVLVLRLLGFLPLLLMVAQILIVYVIRGKSLGWKVKGYAQLNYALMAVLMLLNLLQTLSWDRGKGPMLTTRKCRILVLQVGVSVGEHRLGVVSQRPAQEDLSNGSPLNLFFTEIPVFFLHMGWPGEGKVIKGCCRLLFDRGKMSEPTLWKSSGRSFGVLNFITFHTLACYTEVRNTLGVAPDFWRVSIPLMTVEVKSTRAVQCVVCLIGRFNLLVPEMLTGTVNLPQFVVHLTEKGAVQLNVALVHSLGQVKLHKGSSTREIISELPSQGCRSINLDDWIMPGCARVRLELVGATTGGVGIDPSLRTRMVWRSGHSHSPAMGHPVILSCCARVRCEVFVSGFILLSLSLWEVMK